MAKRKTPESYEVGYRRPPKSSQFRKGQSGNPRGRTKGSTTPSVLLKQILDRRVSVRQDGRSVHMSALEVIFNTTVRQAMLGDTRSLGQLMKLMTVFYPETETTGQHGVLVVPGRMTPSEWAQRFGFEESVALPALGPSDLPPDPTSH